MSKKPCSCIRSEFSILITELNSSALIVHDRSNWVTDDGFVVPDIFDITLSDSTSSQVFGIKRDSTIEGSFPDSIYTASVESCGVKYEQSFLYTAATQCKIDNIVLENDPKNRELINDIKNDLAIAKAAAKFCDFDTAKKIFDKAKEKLNTISCKCNC